MSNISGISGNSFGMMQGMRGMSRPDPSQMAEKLFSKLDSSGQGYIEKSDLQTAFDKVSSLGKSSSGTSSVDELFSKMDVDTDGKVTKQEFSDTLKQLGDQMEQAFQKMRMQAGTFGQQSDAPGQMPDMPPMGKPPGVDGKGMTKDQLSELSSSIESVDSKAAAQLSNLAENFDAADTDKDGKISGKEAQAYEQSTTSKSSGSTKSESGTSGDMEMKFMQQISQLMRAYGIGSEQGASSLMSQISISA